MSNDVKREPQIRFRNYTITWEHRKLGEVGTTFTGLSGKTASDFGHGKASFITYKNVFSNPISDPTMVEHVEIDSKQREVEVGDVFFTTSSETPEEVGMSSVLKEKCGVTYLNSFCFGFRPTEIFDLDYLAFMLRSDSIRSQIKLLAQGISRFNISKTKMMEIDIQVPNIKEQIAIGRCFSQLDDLITFHQQKLNNIKNMKKSLLQKMFTKVNEKVPVIRFYKFTNDWEKRKLGELVDVRSGRDYKHLSEGSIPVYGTGGYMLSVNEALSYNEDAIGIGRKGTINKPYVLKAPFWTVDTLFYAVPREGYELNFIFSVFQNIDWKKKDESTGVPSLSKTVINGICVMAPQYDEQKVIGGCFDQIDNLITLHQQKLEKLQDLKKSMLKKMFI